MDKKEAPIDSLPKGVVVSKNEVRSIILYGCKSHQKKEIRSVNTCPICLWHTHVAVCQEYARVLAAKFEERYNEEHAAICEIGDELQGMKRDARSHEAVKREVIKFIRQYKPTRPPVFILYRYQPHEDNRGFINYDSNSGMLSLVQDRMAATEATLESWQSIAGKLKDFVIVAGEVGDFHFIRGEIPDTKDFTWPSE